MSGDSGIALSLFEYPVAEGNRGAADFKYLNLHFDSVPVTERPAEIRFQVNGGKTDAVSVNDCMILDSQLSGEEFLESHMKIMNEKKLLCNTIEIKISILIKNNQL
jgi:hypothetical protein